MSLASQYGTNVQKEIDGVWFMFAPNPDKTMPRFCLSHMGKNNTTYAKALERATRPYRRQIELKTIDPDIAENVFQSVFIRNVLKAWENVQLEVLDAEGQTVMEDNGKGGKRPQMEKLDFNEENAKRLFERLPYLYLELQALAADASGFRDDEMEDEAKN